jgi:polyisoprenyl-phosphate glycosyltransferase
MKGALYMSRIKLSIISAAYNEESVLPFFIESVVNVCRNLIKTKQISNYEIMLVDDGSIDNTWAIIERAHAGNKRIKGIHFSRNFGHHSAIAAGLDHADGDIIVYMDSDLQAQPEDIPAIIAQFNKGYDMVWGTASKRNDSFIASAGSRLFHWLFNKVTRLKLPNQVVISACSRKAADHIKKLGEFNRFSLALWTFVGFKTACLPVTKNCRLRGEKKYNILSRSRLAISSLVSYSTFPLRLSSILGFVMAIIGITLSCYIVYRKLFLDIPFPGYTSVFAAITFFSGIQFLILGIMGEYIGIIMTETKRRPIYIIENKLL